MHVYVRWKRWICAGGQRRQTGLEGWERGGSGGTRLERGKCSTDNRDCYEKLYKWIGDRRGWLSAKGLGVQVWGSEFRSLMSLLKTVAAETGEFVEFSDLPLRMSGWALGSVRDPVSKKGGEKQGETPAADLCPLAHGCTCTHTCTCTCTHTRICHICIHHIEAYVGII